jgi:transcriptional regulator with XRE-family HTH domain
MPVNIRAKIETLNAAQRKKIEERAAELTAEEMSLRDLRKARKLTQARVAKTLGITQDSVSRLEKRSDLLLSTLRKTVKAMGGDVRILADFPDRDPVLLTKLSEKKTAAQSVAETSTGQWIDCPANDLGVGLPLWLRRWWNRWRGLFGIRGGLRRAC